MNNSTDSAGNRWPDKEKLGLPLFPERSGWHILENEYRDGEEYWWDAELYYWTTAPDGDLIWTPEEAVKDFSYKRICLAPSELDEVLKIHREDVAQKLRIRASGMKKNGWGRVAKMLKRTADEIEEIPHD